MLGGADNPNGELLSYIIGADKSGCAAKYAGRGTKVGALRGAHAG